MYRNNNFYPSTIIAPYYIKLLLKYGKRPLLSLLRTHSLPIKNNLLQMNTVSNNLCEKYTGTYVENEFHLFLRCEA